MIRIAGKLPENTAALIYTPVNRQYLTGFRSSLGYLFIAKSSCTLLVDGRYYIAAKSSVSGCEVELLEKTSEQLKKLVNKSGIKRVITENTITVAELESFQKMLDGISVAADAELTGFLSELRSIKSDAETEKIIKAQRIAEKAFEDLLCCIKPGVSERELAIELDYKMKKYGSERESFDTIAVSGFKSAMPHGVPDEKLIEKGDFITFDFGAVYGGYHSDMTRTVAVEYVTDKMAEVYDTVLRANIAAEKAVASGVLCCDADAAARNVISAAGYGEYFTHSTGHSVGLEIHEQPSLSPACRSVLKSGQIVTDEPGIYIEGEFGVRIEDMLLVTENGCKNLTQFEKSLLII